MDTLGRRSDWNAATRAGRACQAIVASPCLASMTRTPSWKDRHGIVWCSTSMRDSGGRTRSGALTTTHIDGHLSGVSKATLVSVCVEGVGVQEISRSSDEHARRSQRSADQVCAEVPLRNKRGCHQASHRRLCCAEVWQESGRGEGLRCGIWYLIALMVRATTTVPMTRID